MRLRPRYVATFQVNSWRIVRTLDGDAGPLMRIGLVDSLLTRSTFSIWRSREDIMRFAYDRAGVHDPIQRKSLAVPWADDYFFARFRPATAHGTWYGRDPLAGTSTWPMELLGFRRGRKADGYDGDYYVFEP